MTHTADETVQEIVQTISDLNSTSFSSDLDRRLVLSAAQKLVARLQTPLEITTTFCHTSTFVMSAIKALLAMDLFAKWEESGSQPSTCAQLAEMTGSQVSLLDRLLRVVATSGFLSTSGQDDSGNDIYVFTDFAKGTASGRLWNYWYFHTHVLSHCPVALADHLTKNNFHEPTDSKNSPWATHMGKPIMDWAQTNPLVFTYLNEVMAFKDQDAVPWFTFYPAEQLVSGTQGPVLVDIGGGIGNDVKKFTARFASQLAPGQVILQDVPQAIEEAGKLPPAIEKQVHDFFTEQPVKGARAYYLHNVLHDWSLEECLKILVQIKEAMKPGYSRLLIHENVLSLDSTPFACATDLTMMILNAGAERTADQWRDMLAKAGLRLVKIHLPSGVDDGIIEAEN